MNVRVLTAWCLMGSLLAGLLPGLCGAQEASLSAKQHPWGLFQPGAWKTVRVVSEDLDDQGQVVSTSSTDTKTTLLEVGKDGVVLEQETISEVAGKRFAAEPQTIKQAFHGEAACQDLKFSQCTAGEVVIDGDRIPCRLARLECVGAATKTITNVYYSDTLAPYVLRRESVTSDPEGKNTLSETTVEVVAQNIPWRVLTHTQNASMTRTLEKYPKVSVTTWAITSTTVPGGVIGYSSKVTDKSGRVIRRITLELVDYGLQCEEDKERSGVFRRRRGRYPQTSTAASPDSPRS